MPLPDPRPLWKRIGRQSIWGRRGLIKTGGLWLPLAVMLSSNAVPITKGTWLACVQLFVAAVCRTQASTLANDLADLGDDRASGRDRWIQRFAPVAGVSVVVGLFAIGALVLMLSGAAAAALAAYGGAAAVGLLYSVRPVRFKERGLLGPLAFSASCVLVYVVMPMAALSADAVMFAVLAPAVLLDKWVNLHFHQVVDYDADRGRATGTYAVRVGIDRARRTLQPAAGLASLAMLAVVTFLALRASFRGLVAVAVCGGTLIAAAAFARIARQRAGGESALLRELPWHYLGMTYAAFRVLPFLLLAWLAREEATMWVPAGAAGLTLLADSWYFARYKYE